MDGVENPRRLNMLCNKVQRLFQQLVPDLLWHRQSSSDAPNI